MVEFFFSAFAVKQNSFNGRATRDSENEPKGLREGQTDTEKESMEREKSETKQMKRDRRRGKKGGGLWVAFVHIFLLTFHQRL